MSKQQPVLKHKGPIGGPMGGMMGGEKAEDFKGSLSKTIKYMKKQIPAIIISFIFAIAGVICTLNIPNILGTATDEIILGITKSSVYDQFSKIQEDMMSKLPAGTPPLQFKTVKELTDTLSKMSPDSANFVDKIPEKYRTDILAMDLTKKPSVDSEKVFNIIFSLGILVVISAGLGYIQGFIMSGVAQKISYNFRRDIGQKFNTLPLAHFDRTTHGEVLSHITNDVDTISTTLNQSLSQMITSFVTVFGVLYMMLKISISMTLAALIILPLSLGFISIVIKKSQKHFKAQQEYLGHVNGHIEEMYSGHTVVHLFGGEQKSLKKFSSINEHLSSSAWRSQFLSGLMMPVMTFIGNLGYVIICVLGGYLTVNGNITVGNIQAFIQYIRQFNQPIAQLASVTNTLQSTAAAAERVFKFIEQEEEVETGDKVPQNIVGNMSFKNVRFGYNKDKIIVNDFSANIKAGQRIAIVGPTGAGKTTIVKLLMRFYEVNSGDIFLDDVNVSEYKRGALRDVFGMVLQDTWLFNGSIMENIRYGRLDATDEEVKKAAKAACADHFIKTLPDNYNFVISEEAGNISQGQKQLLTIARAILSDPRLLILDEATSSVDTRTELLIQKAMLRLMENKTSFIIAHRLSTIRDADLILVMKDGDIIEQGNHNELIAQNGFYTNLYNSQFTTNIEAS